MSPQAVSLPGSGAISSQVSLTNRALHFTSRLEIETRSGFDRNCLVTMDNYGGIVGDYTLPVAEWARCQLQRKHDRCNRLHGNGWVARTKPDSGGKSQEAYIGDDCADKYFDVYGTYAEDVARARLEIEFDMLTARLRAAYTNLETGGRLAALKTELKRLYDEADAFVESVPKEVLRKLNSMAKSGRAAVSIQVRYDEPGETPSDPPVVTWQERTLGPVRGISAINLESLRALSTKVRQVRNVWEDQTPRDDWSIEKLREKVKILDTLPGLESAITTATAAWDAFSDQANIDRCAFLGSDDEAQRQVFRIARGTSVRKTIADEAWRSARNRISAEHRDRQFRASRQ
jgi:hypothetical protein